MQSISFKAANAPAGDQHIRMVLSKDTRCSGFAEPVDLLNLYGSLPSPHSHCTLFATRTGHGHPCAPNTSEMCAAGHIALLTAVGSARPHEAQKEGPWQPHIPRKTKIFRGSTVAVANRRTKCSWTHRQARRMLKWLEDSVQLI